MRDWQSDSCLSAVWRVSVYLDGSCGSTADAGLYHLQCLMRAERKFFCVKTRGCAGASVLSKFSFFCSMWGHVFSRYSVKVPLRASKDQTLDE